ncbi:DUF397 domain-containing protein [Dactylosporangium aurantiacum]|uniref:DUF397 domain-containing protein n=1 Tax=Dactylosporangium aurantiacum TaxID=35754 RepID=A0A9Q9MCY8_9ACTN|nr:DUF397 domain-containing protein [Dactylosporangium aurantiacum]MDG6107349.1 DUF397 domain-containing protein [Dactylosporangium aurantiacum]UWZ54518.1 DUF397 domain-containing protein [Dactylosporangium aurantiacum]
MQVTKDGVTVDLAAASWVKSSKSGPYSDNCVEVTGLDGPLVAVRDSKSPDGAVLAFTPDEWNAFVAGAQGGEFNRTQ